ncbi:MAG TPA: porin family protein [Dinghuibacter sp.]|jgi:hypothetical protein|uniref:porin family protein n=1 Tax=Dinghuibacter sp. TaxID=2024697 RepID=UPI002C4FC651|nr:porin family protein [Dinghuibacter sp.]HTJ14359.1 porin family protein [Dinghuibacter sp.]
MKKTLLLILVVAGSATASYAQIGFGVKAGYSIATIHADEGSNPITWSSQPAFHAGVLVSIPVVLGLSIQPEVLYSGQGGKFNSDGDPGNLKTALINVPIMIKYSIHGAFLETGPQFGFLASAKITTDGQTTDEKSNFQSTQLAWGVGLGYKLPLGLGIDARYNFALSKMAKSGSDFDAAASDAKNGVFQVGLFFVIGGKK